MSEVSVESELSKAQRELYKPATGEELWQKRARILKQQRYYGSFLPPMDTEPFRDERVRLSTPMTGADRAVRKQFLQDYLVSKSEPRHVPELTKVNPVRGLYRKSFGALTSGLAKLIGPAPAANVTLAVKLVLGSSLVVYAAAYINLYKQQNWTGEQGNTTVLRSRRAYYFNDAVEVTKPKQDFCDQGFKSRNSHQDCKTSWATD